MTVGAVIVGSEAARAQLRPGDVIDSVDAFLPRGWTDLVRYLEDHPGVPVKLAIHRPGSETKETLTVRPVADRDGRGRIGIRQQYVFRSLPWGEAMGMAGQHEARLVGQAFGIAGALLSRAGTAIFTPTGHVHSLAVEAASGWDAFLRVVVTLSVALALLHLLPLPSLDGSRILLTAFEAATGKKVPGRLETTFHALGFIAFAVGIALIAARDLQQVIHLARG
jgi:regulator of sigma E protease